MKKLNRLDKKIKKEKKGPNDYPKFTFRVDPETKVHLHAWLERIYYHYKDRRKVNEAPILRNDILIEALEIGLKEIEEKILKTPILKKKSNIPLDEYKKRHKWEKTKGELF